MTQLSSKKWKNSSLTKKESFIGSATVWTNPMTNLCFGPLSLTSCERSFGFQDQWSSQAFNNGNWLTMLEEDPSVVLWSSTTIKPEIIGPHYMRSFYLQFCVYSIELKSGHFSGTYPLFFGNPWTFYIKIHYIRAYSWSPFLWHIMRSTCIFFIAYT